MCHKLNLKRGKKEAKKKKKGTKKKKENKNPPKICHEAFNRHPTSNRYQLTYGISKFSNKNFK